MWQLAPVIHSAHPPCATHKKSGLVPDFSVKRDLDSNLIPLPMGRRQVSNGGEVQEQCLSQPHRIGEIQEEMTGPSFCALPKEIRAF